MKNGDKSYCMYLDSRFERQFIVVAIQVESNVFEWSLYGQYGVLNLLLSIVRPKNVRRPVPSFECFKLF